MKRIGFAIASIAMAMAGAAALAAGPAAVRRQVEASMVVTGTIQVDTAGKVTGYVLDEKEKLPSAVVEIIDSRVPGWTFEPVLVEGEPAHVTTDMSVRLVAKKIDKDHYTVAIRSAAFGNDYDRSSRAQRVQDDLKAGRERYAMAKKVCEKGLTPPNYPAAAARAGVAANTYLLVKAGLDGRVQDVIAEQVNLKAVADERSMERLRRMFADVAISQARKWCLEPPRDAASVAAGFQVTRVPVTFHLSPLAPYGQWEAYVPGPRQANPWQEQGESRGFSPDALLPGRTYVVGTGLKLLSDITGS